MQTYRGWPALSARRPDADNASLVAMFARAALRNSVRAPATARYFSQTAAANRKVAVLGASGGIGQPVRIGSLI